MNGEAEKSVVVTKKMLSENEKALFDSILNDSPTFYSSTYLPTYIAYYIPAYIPTYLLIYLSVNLQYYLLTNRYW